MGIVIISPENQILYKKGNTFLHLAKSHPKLGSNWQLKTFKNSKNLDYASHSYRDASKSIWPHAAAPSPYSKYLENMFEKLSHYF
jgi:hypothetical protein